MILKEKDNIPVIELPKEVLGGSQAMDFSNMINSSINTDSNGIIIDLTNVEAMNSSGLGMIVGAHTSCVKASKELIVAAPSENILNLFEMTNLLKVIKIEDNLDDAINHLK